MTWQRKASHAAALLLLGGCQWARGSADARPFFFIQMADPQFGFFTANADFAYETARFEKAIAAANRLKPAFVVVAGDLTHRPGNAAQIAEYRRIAAQLDRAIPLYNVPGNHDLALPLTPAAVAEYRRTFGPDYYTFDNHGVFAIVINSSLFKEPELAPAEAAAQERWIKTTVSAAQKAGHRHVIVFQHHPWFLSEAGEPDQYYNLPLAKRREYLDVFERAGVSFIFAGHYHRNAFGKDGDLSMITTGPVGKPLGADSSGFRIVVVDGARVTHRYYPLDSVPARVPTRGSE